MEKPLGPLVPNWQPPGTAFPDFQGRYAALTHLKPSDAPALHAANKLDDRIWHYLYEAPFDSEADYTAWVKKAAASADPHFYTITDLETGQLGGVATYMRINPQAGSIEVGNINFAKRLQRTRAATEAMVLMMAWAFDAGYRRYEWKCNALNAPSRRAAQRLGFSYEGTHRQALIVKGRNRDTAWFSVLDSEWPQLRKAFDTWLDPANFDPQGAQRVSLSSLTRPLLQMIDPG